MIATAVVSDMFYSRDIKFQVLGKVMRVDLYAPDLLVGVKNTGWLLSRWSLEYPQRRSDIEPALAFSS